EEDLRPARRVAEEGRRRLEAGGGPREARRLGKDLHGAIGSAPLPSPFPRERARVRVRFSGLSRPPPPFPPPRGGGGCGRVGFAWRGGGGPAFQSGRSGPAGSGAPAATDAGEAGRASSAAAGSRARP